MKLVDTRMYVGMLRELTEAGKEVSLIVAGSSMAPFLVHHRDTIYFSKPDSPLKRGDMVFYQRIDGQYVMHRIYKVKGRDFYMVGDAQTEIEGPLRERQIFARVTKVRRKGKLIQPGDFWWWFFACVWLRLVPLRPLLIKMYRLCSRS